MIYCSPVERCFLHLTWWLVSSLQYCPDIIVIRIYYVLKQWFVNDGALNWPMFISTDSHLRSVVRLWKVTLLIFIYYLHACFLQIIYSISILSELFSSKHLRLDRCSCVWVHIHVIWLGSSVLHVFICLIVKNWLVALWLMIWLNMMIVTY